MLLFASGVISICHHSRWQKLKKEIRLQPVLWLLDLPESARRDFLFSETLILRPAKTKIHPLLVSGTGESSVIGERSSFCQLNDTSTVFEFKPWEMISCSRSRDRSPAGLSEPEAAGASRRGVFLPLPMIPPLEVKTSLLEAPMHAQKPHAGIS